MKRFFRFSVAGATGFGVDLTTFLLFTYLWDNAHVARVASFLVAVNATFWINKKWTFSDAIRASWRSYVLGQAQGVGINFLIFEGVLFAAGGSQGTELPAFAAGSTGALAFNFLYAKRYAFAGEDREKGTTSSSDGADPSQ